MPDEHQWTGGGTGLLGKCEYQCVALMESLLPLSSGRPEHSAFVRRKVLTFGQAHSRAIWRDSCKS